MGCGSLDMLFDAAGGLLIGPLGAPEAVVNGSCEIANGGLMPGVGRF